jgi:hypothetical protein
MALQVLGRKDTLFVQHGITGDILKYYLTNNPPIDSKSDLSVFPGDRMKRPYFVSVAAPYLNMVVETVKYIGCTPILLSPNPSMRRLGIVQSHRTRSDENPRREAIDPFRKKRGRRTVIVERR